MCYRLIALAGAVIGLVTGSRLGDHFSKPQVWIDAAALNFTVLHFPRSDD